jgi:hypothetical protein
MYSIYRHNESAIRLYFYIVNNHQMYSIYGHNESAITTI